LIAFLVAAYDIPSYESGVRRSNLLGRATSYALSTPSAPILCFEPDPTFKRGGDF